MDTKLIKDDDGKVYKSCDTGEESQKEEPFDVGFKVWRTFLVSGIINVVLFGILACQGIHLVVSEVLPKEINSNFICDVESSIGFLTRM